MHDQSEKIANKYNDVSDVISLPSVILQINGKNNLPDTTLQIRNAIENIPNSLKNTVISDNKKYDIFQFHVNPDLSSAEQLKF
ncbi:hypothetical protein ACQKCU_21790 [Heyndrickxia sporothermodurans]